MAIANLQISSISDDDLQKAFLTVVVQQREAVISIHQSMLDADEAWRKYLASDYEPDEAGAKKDRAILNKAEKNIAAKFSELKSAYEKPLAGIETNIKSIRNAIKEASRVVDGAVKTYEDAQRLKKFGEIENYFNMKGFELVTLDKLFDSRWLNKTVKLPEVYKELDAKIIKIYQDVKTLELIPDYGMTAKTLYLKTLDISESMQMVDEMKANAERLAKEKAERAEREHREAVETNIREQRAEALKEVREQKVNEVVGGLVAEALGIPETDAYNASSVEKPRIVETVLRFRGIKEAVEGLKTYMSLNNIAYSILEKTHYVDE
jgi:hypothetical protein